MKRRINTKFLMIVTLSVVGLGVLGIIVKRVFFKQRPEQFIRNAEKEAQDGKYELAAMDFERAFVLSNPKDADLLVKEGEVLGLLVQTDVESIGRDTRAYRRALEVDPKSKVALQKMVQAYTEQIEFYPNQQTLYNQLKSYSQRLYEIDPSDKATKAKIYTAGVTAWLNGVATDPKEIEDEIAQLGKIMEEDPANADVPYIMGLAKLQQASDAQRAGKATDRERLRNEAAGIIEQAIAAQPNNPEMHVKAAMTYAAMARAGRSAADPQNKEWSDRFKKELARSRELVDPKNTKYVELQATAGMLLTQMGGPGDREAAQALLEQLLKENPNEPSIRLNYARLMRGTYEGRQKAIDWLNKPIDRTQMRSSQKLQMLQDYETQMLVDATGLRMEQYITEKDEAKRADWMKQVQDGVDKVGRLLGEQPAALTLRGRLLQLQGKNTEAIQTLEKSRSLLAQQKRPKDFELIFALARGYMQQGETGQARGLLMELTSSLDAFVPARIMLVQMFLQENQLNDPRNPTNPLTADGQLSVLETLAPDDPEVARLRLVYYILKDMPEQAKGMLIRLPEKTVDQILVKATMALQLKDNDETVRLLQLGIKMDPTRLEVVSSLAGMLLNAGKRDEAVAVVTEALKNKPDDQMLKMVYKRVTMVSTTNPTEKELKDLQKTLVDDMKDPAERELYYYEQERAKGNTQEALKHLDAVEKARPNDISVLNLRFQNYMLAKDWDNVMKYVEKLGALNADKAGGSVYRFRALLAKNDLDGALAQAKDLTKKLPEFSVSWLCLGQALQAMGQYKYAIDQGYLQAMEKRTENAQALRGIIDCYYAQGDPDNALRYIQRARILLPDNQFFVNMEIDHSLTRGDGRLAALAREESLKQNPNDAANYENAAIAYLREMRWFGESNPTGVGQVAHRIQELMDIAIAKWPEQSTFYAHKADVAIVTGNYEAGEGTLKKLSLRPEWKDKPQPLRMLGDFYSHFGKLELAERAYTDASALAPKDVALRQHLAAAQAQQNKTNEAIKTLEPVIGELNVQKQEVQILMGAGKSGDAEKFINSLLEKNSKSVDALRMLMSVYTDSQHYDKALEIAQKMLDADPNDVSALLSRGLIEMQGATPKLDDAIKDLKAVKEKAPSNIDARYWLAMAYRQKGDGDGAIREMDTALQQMPANKNLRLKLIEFCTTSSQWQEVERLIRDAEALSQFKSDATWPMAEADMWLQRKRPDRSWTAIQMAYQMAPDDLSVQQKYLNVMLENKLNKEAIDASDAMLKKGTDTWWLRADRGTAKHRLEQKDESLAEFEKAVANPAAQQNDSITTQIMQTMAREIGVAEALTQLGPKAQTENKWRLLAAYLYQVQGDLPRAIQYVEQVLAEEKTLPPAQLDAALRLSGTLYLSLKPVPDYEKAKTMFKRVLDRNPDDIGALNNMACLLVDMVNPPQPDEGLKYAKRAYDAARRTNQMPPMVADTYGWALVNCTKGGQEEAQQVEAGFTLLRQVVERTPFVDAHYHLGWTYVEKKSMPEEAANQLSLAAGLVDNLKKTNAPYDANLERKIHLSWDKARSMMEIKSQVRGP